MFKKKQWLAVVRGNHWVVAQVARRKFNLNILRLSEFRPEPVFADSLEYLEEKAHEQTEGHQEEESSTGGRNASSLKEWLQKNHVPVKKLRLAVSCPGVITRMITLPLMSVQDLDELLTLQVDQYFTLNISDYVVDYRVLERLIEDGEMRQRVLLAALPKYQWEKLWSEWEEIGFKPDVVDLAADGLARLYSQLSSRGKNQASKAEVEVPLDLAIVELSADRVEFVLLEHGVFFLYSDLEVALDGLDQVARTVTSQESRAELPEEQQDLELQTAKLHDWTKTEIEASLGNVLQSVSEFFSFFAARHFGKAIDRIYLTGDYANLPFLPEIFEKNLEVQTQVGFPNAWRPRYSRRIRRLQNDGIKYGSLYGLAFREG
ncbi:pilus assembly protein PilM [Desulfosporosinus metallidurans]|uniref:Type IV pilus biogenesis protein PilM n=1 Tax=Desulfosporosinus metallidurans TaxID=1888891 RepID=A0A1Q8QXZ9_9FIRM|nr:pilus assembly protein PilM [Desulfosporosinus metallidurans]OLN32232.1 Type IV pilus biogenesis protein PilM [Desulfosporosinus metallidurans]